MNYLLVFELGLYIIVGGILPAILLQKMKNEPRKIVAKTIFVVESAFIIGFLTIAITTVIIDIFNFPLAILAVLIMVKFLVFIWITLMVIGYCERHGVIKHGQ